MREILFKAKRKDNGEWVEGYYAFIDNIHYIFTGKLDTITFLSKGAECFEIDPNTLCQYTGLTDKNGKKIWEGDIVKYHFGNDVAPIRFGEYQSCFDSAKTGHIGFYVDWNCKRALRKDLGYWVNMIDCEIIGNIFDNPELMKGEEHDT